MNAARNLVLAVLLGPLVACGGSAGPSGPLLQVTKVASAQPVADLAFENFLADLKVDPAIADQVRASRAAVNAQVKPIKLTSFSAHQGARIGGPPDLLVPPVLMPLLFAGTLADALDPLTSGLTSGGETPSKPLTSTIDGPATTTTTFLNTTTNLSVSGSNVMLTMHWTYRETTTDKATGQKVLDINDDRTMVGSLNVCPDASGVAPAKLDVQFEISSGASTRKATSSNTFSGHVDDQAVLRRVTHDMQQQESWQNGSGSGSYEFNGTNFNWSAGESGMSGGLDANGVGGSMSQSGNASADVATKEAGGMVAIDKAAVDPGYQQAQRLWRNGRCVVIQTPEYKAETPVPVAEQDKMQHDEEVDTDSQTKFGVSLRHRFGGSLSQPVKASVSGEKKLEPKDIKSGSGSLTYTAPGEDDKQATVTLKSVSRRGIGTLVVSFHTKGKHLKLSARGALNVTFGGFLNLAWNITINPANFNRAGADSWEGQATAKGTGRYTNLPINCNIQFTETANITFVATRETRAGQAVWVVKLDQLRSSAHDVGAPCVGGTFGAQFPTSGYTVIALLTVGDIVIPADGGTVTVSGSRTVASATHKATLTFTATVTEQ